METLAASLATLALVLGKTVYEVVRDRRGREDCPPASGDCYSPEDRRRSRKMHENIIKMCIYNGIDPEV